jgi:hypothetical protein
MASTHRKTWFIVLLTSALCLCAGLGAWILIVGPQHAKKQLAPIAKSTIDEIVRPRPPYELSGEERQILQQARERSATMRRGRATLTLLDDRGKALPEGTRVRYRLAKHAFGLGNYDAAQSQFERLWGTHKNLAFALTIWTNVYRESPGVYDFRKAEAYYTSEWRRAVGLTVGWHNVVWIIDKVESNGEAEIRVPMDLRDLPFAEKRERILDWTRRAARYTDGKYDIVNVYNEPLNHWTDPYKWGDAVRYQLLKDVVRTFREHNRTSEVQISIGEALTKGKGRKAEALLKWIRDNEVPIDRVALQAWCNGAFPWGEAMPILTLQQFHDRLSALAQYGFKLDISEFQAPASGAKHPSWNWTEARQADWAEACFEVAFGIPGVASICYFRSRDSFLEDGSLYDPNGLLRPVSDRLFSLIERWHSSGEARVDAQGRLVLEGYAGTYALAPVDGETIAWRYDLLPQQATEATVPAGPAPGSVPAPLGRMGPFVTPEHVLAVRVEALPAEEGPVSPELGQDAMEDIVPLRYASHGGEAKGMRHLGQTVEIGGERLSGFCVDAVPAPAAALVLDLLLPDHGCTLELGVLDRTRRFIQTDLAPGRYRLSIPLEAQSRPVLHLSVPYRLHERYAEKPYGILTRARYLSE